jgi:para-nitrobenzyl esterase
MGWRRVLGIMSVVGVLCPGLAHAHAQAGGQPGSVARTENGPVRGLVHSDYTQYLGVPYAAPPVGGLRWRPPEPARDWRGVLDGTAPRSQCAQLALFASPESLSEDCLYLNVTVPRRVRHGTPVLVWFHGGSFLAGGGDIYDGRRLAAEGGIVVVTVNYRMGPLGFLALPSLSEEETGIQSGNYGLEDQQAALRWVRRNIAAFGGNPRDVTIAGQSAGAVSNCLHLASPTAAGLFQKAIAMSGSCTWELPTTSQAEADGSVFAAELGCADPETAADCLRGEEVADLLRAWPGGTPVIGGREFPVQPAEALRADRFAHVPLLLGNTLDEERFTVSLRYDGAGNPVTPADYPGIIRGTYGAAADQVLARYPLERFPTPGIALATVGSDSLPPLGTCEHLRAYRSFTARPFPVPVYAYQFADRTAPPLVDVPGFDEGAAHVTDVNYLFPQVFGPPLRQAQQDLARTIVRYWANFVRTGDPNGSGLPAWPRFRTSSDVLSLDLGPGGIHPVDIGAAGNCAFWDGVLHRERGLPRLPPRPR